MVVMKHTLNNMNQQIGVKEWVALFREIGLDEPKMKQWHRLFESRHADAHQAFLVWLGLPPKEIERIRAGSR